MEVQELRPGLWRWASPHPEWEPDEGLPREVGSVYYEAPAAVVLIDPLVPVADEQRFWEALDRDVARLDRPVVVLLTVPWHERSTVQIVERYGASRPEEPPAGVSALSIAGVGGERETIYRLEAPEALVFGDVVVGDGTHGIRITDEWLPEDRRGTPIRKDLAALLDHPVGLLLPSHGVPVVERAHGILTAALKA